MIPEYSRWDELKSNWPYLLTLAPPALEWGRMRDYASGWVDAGLETLVGLLTLSLIIVIQKQRRDLEESSITDKLTGLFNSRHLRTELDRQVSLTKRIRSPLSMIFLDLDEFKSINDRYGHAVGDMILRRVAQSLLGAVRQHVDLCFRFGGDEFLILCPHTHIDEAARIAARIIEAQNDLQGLNNEKLTLSLSVSALREEESPRMFLERADRAQYQAKRNGKNRMVFNR